jgi:RimJ/RimL family protein N-acetyltransferase
MLGDPEVVRHLGGKTMSREESWRRMASAAGMWLLLGYGYWAVENREDGAYLGLIGFADFKRDMRPKIEGRPEMGWIFLPEAQGKGYACEAGAAALEWADKLLAGQEIVAIINPENGPSLRLASKLGFGKGNEAAYGTETVMLLRRPASPAAAATAAAASA